MIGSADLIVCCNPALSFFVAEQNQTVMWCADICAHDRLDNGIVENNQQLLWLVELPELMQEVLYYYYATPIFQTESKCEDHFRSCDKVDTRNLNWSPVETLLCRKVIGGVSEKVHQHLHFFDREQLQVVLTAPMNELVHLLSDLSSFWMRPIMVVSSEQEASDPLTGGGA